MGTQINKQTEWGVSETKPDETQIFETETEAQRIPILLETKTL